MACLYSDNLLLFPPCFLVNATHNHPLLIMPLFNLEMFDDDPQAYIESMTMREITEYRLSVSQYTLDIRCSFIA